MNSRLAGPVRRIGSSRLSAPATSSSSPPIVVCPGAPKHSRRSLFGFGKQPAAKKSGRQQEALPRKPVLSQDDLFHPLSQSPFAEMRQKGERIKQLAFCPVSLEKYGEKVHVAYECEHCGYPTHASQERWAEDEHKAKYWPRLREANEDEHDLRSGREMTEFKLPGGQSLFPRASGPSG